MSQRLVFTVAAAVLLGRINARLTGWDGVDPPQPTDPCRSPWKKPADPQTYDWIRTVHIVSMTHLDIGGWGPGADECENACTYARDVCNTYFRSYLPLAASASRKAHLDVISNVSSPPFVYDTHPWILNEFLTADAGCGDPGRNETEVAAVIAAVKSGGIQWQAKPFTMIHELCDPHLFEWSLGIAKRLNTRLGTTNGLIAAKISDLPGVSIGIIPALAKAGVQVLHIGTNGQGNQVFPSFPNGGNLPQVFVWRHPVTSDEIVVMNEQGYGTKIVLPDKYGFEHALRWQFTGDNLQPPTVKEIEACWAWARHEFPNATTFLASSLDDFGRVLLQIKDKLPVVTREIGNAWLPQMATDPYRLRAHRAITRMRSQWIESGAINETDPHLQAYSAQLLIPIEHNFGMQKSKVIADSEYTAHWTNAQFRAAVSANPEPYAALDEYAQERDRFLAPQAGRTGASRAFIKFAAAVNKTLESLRVVPSIKDRLVASGLRAMNVSTGAPIVIRNSRLVLAINSSTGEIVSLIDSAHNPPRHWSSESNRIGGFVYRTYTQEADLDRYVAQFTPDYAGIYPHHMNKSTDYNGSCWNKYGMDDAIRRDPAMPPLETLSRYWAASVHRVWASESTAIVNLVLPDAAVGLLGGAAEITLNVTLSPPTTRSTEAAVELTLSWKNKTATRLAESAWLSFNPIVAEPSRGWTLDVLGAPVDPLSVVVNGSRHFHAVYRGVCYENDNYVLAIETMDTPFVSPGDTDHMMNFDNSLPDLSGGMHFNLHNNVGWDCSAPWWSGDDAKFRFRLRLDAGPRCGWD